MEDLDRLTAGVATRDHRAAVLWRWKTGLLTVTIVGGMLGAAAVVFRDSLMPGVRVEAARVVLLEDMDARSSDQIREELLFQASGWIEPDPWPTRVSTLVSGTLKELAVREGDVVRAGQLIARLDAEEAQLALREQLAMETAARSGVAAASNSLVAARTRQEAGRARVDGAEAWLTEARDVWQRYSALTTRELAERERVAAQRALIVAETEVATARALLATADAAVAESSAMLEMRRAERAVSTHRRELADLALRRMEIRAPAAGVVLKRYVGPGGKRMLAADDPESAVVVSLFDPARLQVRVDVPLAEAGRLRVGMPTRIHSALTSGKVFEGVVTQIVGQADLQRNTLQAKVAISDPDPRMRPEVLCRVEFLSPAVEGGDPRAAGAGRHTLWIPEEALDGDGEEQMVWVVDSLAHRVDMRRVRLAEERRNGLRRVVDGVRANELIVTRGMTSLAAGTRVVVESLKEAE